MWSDEPEQGFCLSRRDLIRQGFALASLAAPQAWAALSIEIGVAAKLSGTGAADGLKALKTINAVVTEFNQAGGVAGRAIGLIHADVGVGAENGASAARKLIDEGASVVVAACLPALAEAVPAG